MAITENFDWFTPDPTDRLVDLPDHLGMLAAQIDSRVYGLPWNYLTTVDGASTPSGEDAQYRILNGVCHLWGRVSNSGDPGTASRGLVAIPPEARPYGGQFIGVAMQGGTSLVRLFYDDASRWLSADKEIEGTNPNTANLISLHGICWVLDSQV